MITINKHSEFEGNQNIEPVKQYPCLSCSALCCRTLQLESFPLQHYLDLDKSRYYLNFSNLEIMLLSENKAMLFFTGFCRFLNTEAYTCKIHNRPEQPNLCVHYNPYKCFYKKADADKQHIVHGKFWLNKERLGLFEQKLLFNSQREIVEFPSANELFQQFNLIPYTKNYESEIIKGEGDAVQLQPPCIDCGGLCCSSLLFPGKQPHTIQGLDFIRYALGYSEVEYLINRNDWIMKVNVRCRYLDTNNRCSVYEKPERPLYCRYFNPHKCTIKPTIRQYHLSVKLEQFNQISKHIVIDNNGKIQEFPSLASLKKILETPKGE